MKPTPYIWFDGALRPWAEASVHVLSHGLHYGFGVFEGIRAYDLGDGRGGAFRLEEHCRRFTETARIAGLSLELSAEALADACLETLAANGEASAYIRPLCWLGEGPMDVVSTKNEVHVAIGTWGWGAYLGEEGLEKGIRCQISTFRRIGLAGHLPKGKICGHYVNSILAKDEARRLGFDEALMMDGDGHVLEGSSENLFFVRDGVIITPPKDAPILGGITRASVIQIAEEMGLKVEERLFGRDALYLADEVFLTGTAAEVTPVREIDGRKIGCGARGAITGELQARYKAATRGEMHSEWVTAFEPRIADVEELRPAANR